MILYLDTETRSEVPIRYGTTNYVNGEHFNVLMVAWAINDDEPRVWEPITGEPMPMRLQRATKNPETIFVFHNSTFDRNVINKSRIFGGRLSAELIVDTMVQAMAHGLPGGLDKLSEVFGLDDTQAKDKAGRALINTFCVPVGGYAATPVTFNDWTTHPEEWQMFRKYAISDINAMRQVHKRTPKVNYPQLEHKLWVFDQKINDRGIPVDVEFAQAAMHEAAEERKRLNAMTVEATDGEIQAATQRDALLKHLAKQHDVWLPDLKTSTLERRLDDPDLPADLRHLIELRLQSSKNSAAKYRRLVQNQHNGRLQYTMQMYGASRTGRDAGRVFQPQNLMRPDMWRGLSGASLEEAIRVEVESVRNGTVSLLSDNVMRVLGNCVRSAIAAPQGYKFCNADLSNIEGRGLVWLADEKWKLKYFEDFDNGKVPFDNYVMAYAKAMGVEPVSVDDYMRQIGKVMELGLGYGGGVAAFITFANVYRLDISELAQAVWANGDPYRLNDCSNKYGWALDNKYHAGLNQEQYAACEYLKQLWRESHPLTVAFWNDLEQAFRMATAYDKETFDVGPHLKFRRQGPWLYIRLPSGRCLTYLQPKVIDGQCTFRGLDPFTKQFKRVKTYSGRLAENVTSGAARDVMFHRMPLIEREGYGIVLRVHDELLAQVPDTDKHSGADLARLMALPHEWTTGLPLAAQGVDMHIYHKT